MREISSTQNAYIKELRSLKEKKYRDRFRKYLIEGEKVVAEALGSAVLIESVLTVDPECPQARLAGEKGLDVILIPEFIFDSLSDVKTPQKVMACILMQETEIVEAKGLVACADSIRDPQNLGAIIRTADAVGATCVVVSPDSADPYGPRAQRAAMGSTFHLPVIIEDVGDFLERFKSRGGQIIAGVLEGTSSLGAVRDSVCVVVGNESRGVGERARGLADIAYRIPIYGQAESLNAAVAAGIMMYDIKRSWKV